MKAFIFGLLAALGALIAELTISDLYFILLGKDLETNYFNQITLFLVAVVLIEEFFKYIMLIKLYASQKNQTTNISIALLAGLGFACMELAFTGLNFFFNPETVNFNWSVAGVFILHLATTGIIGSLIIFRKKTGLFSAAKIITVTACLHLAYNLMIIYSLNFWLVFLYLVIMFGTVFKFSRQTTAKMPNSGIS